ncbi:LVIVD repeat-containing protein [Alkaliflexus imshenetskii]|uniref:LVIVD repeat-containing protein n=1 Tax=Alkaliflexus imshenetskii TaxID=286730 RepID=UPI000A02617F|nr:hypothetical protein [Alkaliflexus imshenetskii]
MDTYTEEFRANAPIYMTFDKLRAAVKASSARNLEKPGKIYFKDDHIFVVEFMKGVHVLDLSNPKSPQNVAFIEIPGCVDIAVRYNILYADSFVDLVSIDVSDVTSIKEVARVQDALPYMVPPTGNNYRQLDVNREQGVVVDWRVETIRQELEPQYYPIYPTWRWMHNDWAFFGSGNGVGGSSGSTVGVAGSMARFGLYNDFLYAVDISTCYFFDVSAPDNPVAAGKQNVGWDVETIFMYDNHMFLGTSSGMRIFSLEVPLAPLLVSNFWHVTACDPVVVADGYAYVTLRGGTMCGSNVNRLDVIQLSENYKNNTLVGSFDMVSPYGLGIDGSVLFVCEGDAGLKVFDATDKTRIKQNEIVRFPFIKAYDVIPINGLLFMIGDDGFYLYDYSDIKNISLMSHIPVG